VAIMAARAVVGVTKTIAAATSTAKQMSRFLIPAQH
jgi:hypothetical protein